MATKPGHDDLTGDLANLASSIGALPIPDDPGSAPLRERQDRLVRTVRDYLMPRVGDPEAPLIVVFAGPTGAGKSTMLNSVIGSARSPAGPLRPTTTGTVVLTSETKPADLSRIDGVPYQVITGRLPALEELILVDTPDIDSTSTEHRELAEMMIDHADVVVFVNSAIRYADLIPWEVLRRANARDVPVIPVLNRISVSARGALPDFSSRLEREGLESKVVAVQEHHIPRGAQRVPPGAVRELRERLVGVIEERRAGAVDIVRSVLDTTLAQALDLVDEVRALAEESALGGTNRSLNVDPGRIGTLIGDLPGLDVDLRGLAALALASFKPRWRIRRKAPDGSSVTLANELLDEALVAAVDADLRQQIHSGLLVDGEDRAGLLAAAHLGARTAVAAWRRDLARVPSVSRSALPQLSALLLGRAVFASPGDEETDVFVLLSPGIDLVAEAAGVEDDLMGHLGAVYAAAEDKVTSATDAIAESRRSIERVRASRWAVIARSSLANA